MPKSMTIRNIPDEAAAELAARAALSGRSLQEYLRAQLIGLVNRPDPEALIARAHARKARTESRLASDAILRHRDAERP
jgi:plasmid stability protein